MSHQNEDVETSVELKQQMVQQLKEYPEKLEHYVHNYIQTERQVIVDAADAEIRSVILPIEYQHQAINLNRKKRQSEMRDTEEKYYDACDQLNRMKEKDLKAETKLREILDQVQNKLNLMQLEGYC